MTTDKPKPGDVYVSSKGDRYTVTCLAEDVTYKGYYRVVAEDASGNHICQSLAFWTHSPRMNGDTEAPLTFHREGSKQAERALTTVEKREKLRAASRAKQAPEKKKRTYTRRKR